MQYVSNLPSESIVEIAKKLPPIEFSRFLRSSRNVHDACRLERHKVPVLVSSIYFKKNLLVDIHIGSRVIDYNSELSNEQTKFFTIKSTEIAIQDDLNVELCMKIFLVATELNLSCTSMHLRTINDSVLGDLLNSILQLIKPPTLFVFLVTRSIPLSTFNQIPEVFFGKTYYTDSDIASCRIKTMGLNSEYLTSRSVISVIKELQFGDRELNFIRLWGFRVNLQEIIDSVQMSLLFRREDHSDSVLCHIPRNELSSLLLNGVFYVVWNVKNPSDMYLVIIRQIEVDIFKTDDPKGELLKYLPILKVCKECIS